MKPRITYIRFLYFLLFTFVFLLEANATARYVSKTGSSTPPYTSWLTASDSIQKCINICQSGDTVYVANGVYKEQVVMIPGLSLIGGGMDSCIINTEEFAVPTDFYAITLKDSCNFSGFQVIVSNETYGTGVLGIDILDSNSKFSQNYIRNASTGMWLSNINFSVSDNVFSNTNRCIRFDCFTYDYFPVIDNNIILYPSSQGIFDFQGCQPTITNNIIYLNYKYSRGFEFIVKTPLTANNILIADSDEILRGYSFTQDGNVRNNLLIGHAIGDRAFIFSYGNFQAINNLIMNTSQGASVYGNIKIHYQYNNLWNVANPYLGFTPDSTNLSVDPMIVSEDSVDFHLQMYSPLIDTGDPTILDRDGSRSDIGPFGGPYGEKYTYRDLAPKPPSNVSAVYENKAVNIKWNRNTEADFSHYGIYRDTVPNFIYDTTKIVGVTIDTLFIDNLPINLAAKNYYYLITAFDSTNHQSAPSEELLVVITGMNEVPPKVVEEYKLLNNYPNPFNASTKIPYRLKEPGYVKLYIYDMKGELVKVLVNEWQNKGYYEVEFSPNENERKRGETGIEYWTGYNDDIASGRYIYQIIVIGEGNIPVFGSMGKMILLK